jgi:hypothetical protein
MGYCWVTQLKVNLLQLLLVLQPGLTLQTQQQGSIFKQP